MWRGTTPKHIYTLPTDYSAEDFSAIFITYWQNGEPVLEKTEDDITATSTGFELSLTQAETLKFVPGPVKIQLRAKLPDGTAIASDIITTSAKEILKDGVI